MRRLLLSSPQEREKMGPRVLSSTEVMQQFPRSPMTLEHSPWQAGYSTGHIWNKLDLKEPIILAPVILGSLLSSLAVDNGFMFFDQIDWGAEWNRIHWKSSYPSSSQSAEESNSGESLFPSGGGGGGGSKDQSSSSCSACAVIGSIRDVSAAPTSGSNYNSYMS